MGSSFARLMLGGGIVIRRGLGLVWSLTSRLIRRGRSGRRQMGVWMQIDFGSGGSFAREGCLNGRGLFRGF